MNKEYTYYAFISYRRSDEKWARWLQRSLETYRFPTAIKKTNIDLPKKIFPIFRDKTDLSSGGLIDNLHHMLDESEYLIVICSPESAAKGGYVDQEVAYFQSLGRNENIIPVIVEGTPNAAFPTEECFCPSLRRSDLPQLLGVSISELGKRGALLRVIATMMKLRYDQLVMRDKKRQRKRIAGAAVGAAAAVAILGGVIWYDMPHIEYYPSVIYRYEIPEGYGGKLSAAERSHMSASYRLTRRRGKIIKLEVVDSMDNLTAEKITSFLTEDTFYPAKEFEYSQSGDLISTECFDANGDLVIVRRYDRDAEGIINAVSFENPGDRSLIATLNSESKEVNYKAISAMSQALADNYGITRELLEFDGNGFLYREMYMRDNRNNPKMNSNGTYGKQFLNDDNGLCYEITYLDRTGEPVTHTKESKAVKCECLYDDKGNLIQVVSFDKDGDPALGNELYAKTVLELDSYGNVVSIKRYDTDGDPCYDKNGISQYQYKLDDSGKIIGISYFAPDGSPTPQKNTYIYSRGYEYDENERVVSESYYGIDGAPTMSGAHVSSIRTVYDDIGRLTELRFYDTNGERTIGWGGADSNVNSTFLSKGAIYESAYSINTYNTSGYKVEFDGNVEKITLLDCDDAPTIGPCGYASVEQETDSTGQLIRESFFDENGAPVRANYNAAEIRYTWNKAMKLTDIEYFDEEGEPCLNMYGAASLNISYNDAGYPKMMQFYDENKEKCWVSGDIDMLSAVSFEIDSLGQLLSLKHYSPDGGMIARSYYAEERYSYDDHGNLITTGYYDSIGRLTNSADNYAYEENTYDDLDRLKSVRKNTKDDTPYSEEGKYYLVEYEYDERGNITVIKQHGIDKDNGDYTEYIECEYNDADIMVHRKYYGIISATGELRFGSDYYIEPDSFGKSIKVTHYNKDGEIKDYVMNEYDDNDHSWKKNIQQNAAGETTQVTERTYDQYGNEVIKRTYDADGNIIIDKNGIAWTETTYDCMHNVIRLAYYDENGELINQKDGYAVRENTYNKLGKILESTFYDKDGRQDTLVYAKIIYDYTRFGWLAQDMYYDHNMQLAPWREGSSISGTKYVVGNDGVQRKCVSYDLNGDVFFTRISIPRIMRVTEGSLADKAGLKDGDYILHFNSWDILDYESPEEMDLYKLMTLQNEEAGKEIHLVVYNEDEKKIRSVVLEKKDYNCITDYDVGEYWVEKAITAYRKYLEDGGVVN